MKDYVSFFFPFTGFLCVFIVVHYAGYLIDMRMPIFVMNSFRCPIVNAGNERWMGKINGIYVDGKLIGNGFCYFTANYLQEIVIDWIIYKMRFNEYSIQIIYYIVHLLCMLSMRLHSGILSPRVMCKC